MCVLMIVLSALTGCLFALLLLICCFFANQDVSVLELSQLTR